MALPVGRALRIVSTLVVLCGAGAVLRGQEATPSEAVVKAVFLYNFSKYVSWPESPVTPEAPPSAFLVCVIADREFTEEVRRTIEGETVAGRRLSTVQPQTVEAARQCRMLFVGDSAMNRAAPMLRGLSDAPVLTVGEGQGFLDRGGVIAFVRVGRNVRFDIDRVNAQRRGLTISSQLLRVARSVREQ